MDPEFISCGTIGSRHIFRNDLLRVFQVDEWMVKLSLKEYLLMMNLTSGKLITERALIHALYGSVDTPSHIEPFSKHLERLRKKLRPSGLIIRRITQYGYLLACSEEETAAT